MTIRYTLLMSYLLISLASALLITLMIFVHLREILRAEIEEKLKSQATTIMQQIDTYSGPRNPDSTIRWCLS